MARFSSERGSALIETLVAAPVVAIVLVAGSLLLYRWFAELWMTRAAREAAVCLTTSQSESRCRKRLESTLKIGLPVGKAEIEKCRLQRRESNVRITLDLRSIFRKEVDSLPSDFQFPTRIETEISFPRFD